MAKLNEVNFVIHSCTFLKHRTQLQKYIICNHTTWCHPNEAWTP